MSDINPPPPPRPKLKLNVGSRQASFSEPNASNSATTPLTTPKIRIKSSQPPTPAETSTPVSAKTKAGRQTKPTSKLIESKKREQDDVDDDGDLLSASQPPKKIKLLKTPTITRPNQRLNVVVKSKGKPPYHPPGDGYDSEASDQEVDPVIEEQFVLRMMPGEHCEYIRKAIEENKFGARKDGGADITMKFFDDESRRAVVVVKGQLYAAVMLELPTITEGMKTWDRKSFMKSADICHMLLVFQPVKSDEEAKKAPLPSMVQPGFKWPHGLTPPMHDAVNQRFAKVISRTEIELKENEVTKLLQADAAAISSKFEFIDDRRLQSEEEYSDPEQDADGEMDDSGYFPPINGYDEDDPTLDEDLMAEMEAALEEEANGDVEMGGSAITPATQLEGATPMTANTETPAAGGQGSVNGDGSVDAISDDDDDDDDVDEDEQARLDEVNGVKEDIADLERQIAKQQETMNLQSNSYLRKRAENNIKNLRNELKVKQASIGQEVDD